MVTNNIFDYGDYDIYLSKSNLVCIDPNVTLVYSVSNKRWQSVIQDSLYKCKNGEDGVNINDVIVNTIETFDDLGIGYEGFCNNVLEGDVRAIKDYPGISQKVSEDYIDLNIDYLIYTIFKYMLYLDENKYIEMDTKDPSKYTDYGLLLTGKFYDSYKLYQ